MALARRAAFLVGAVWLAASIAFVLIHLAPGGPAIALGGESGAPGYLEEVERLYGLDRPLPEIYLSWLADVMTGDLGFSYRSQQPVLTLILDRLPVTLALVGPAMVLAATAGMILGLARIPRPGRPRRGFVAAMAALHALPSYIVGQGLVIVFALWLGLLPVQGLVDARAVTTGPARVLDMARHLVLPVVALALHHLTFMALLTRARVADELERPYAVTAAAKGLTAAAIRRRHALPNAALGIATLFGARLGAFVAGAVVIETAFGLPGLGRLAVTSAVARDHPVVIGIVLATTAVVVAANLGVDAVLGRLDPRLAKADP
ncbi:MAG: ABC transporter permease [Pseudomonadota bacterium]